MGFLRLTTAGESHGPWEVTILEGIPSGLHLSPTHIDRDLARRQQGHGRGGRMRIEADTCRLVGGVRHQQTLGSPICIAVENRDHANWSVMMSPEVVPEPGSPECPPVTLPRPGHADLAGVSKYGIEDIRNVLERASARETLTRVAGGAVCKRMLQELGVSVRAHVTSIGDICAPAVHGYSDPSVIDWEAVESSPVGCRDGGTSEAMCACIDEARESGESLGGVFEVWCWGVCPGLGGYSTLEARLDARLLGALGSIPAIKGAEVGRAFDNARERGSAVHDALLLHDDHRGRWIRRETNRAGGLEGGMSTGMPIVLRAAMKPIPTLTSALPSVDIRTLEPSRAHVERSDVTAVPAARVVGEAMAAYVLAAAYLEKFGGDSMDDLLRSVGSYEARLEERGLWHRL